MTPTRAPGRPRSPEADAAILDATLEEYAERGFSSMSIDGVAARAGVGKATIYRRYDSKLELVTAAMYASAEQRTAPDTGTLEGDLRALLHVVAEVFLHPIIGAGIRHLVSDSQGSPELRAVHEEFMQHRRSGWKVALRRAIERDDLPADLDLEIAVDLLTGPVTLRSLVTHMPIDDAFLQQVLDGFLRAYARR